MANQLYGNPIVFDTSGVAWSGMKYVKQAQWVDDAGDIEQDSTCVILVNGTTITAQVADIDTTASTTHWQLGPFNKGVPWEDVTITISHGAVIIWIE